MNTLELANKLIQLYIEGKSFEAITELYDDDILSHELKGSDIELADGKEAVLNKRQNWVDMVEEIHSAKVSAPIVSGDFFACSMDLDVTYRGIGRSMMNEICVYQVERGKIVAEWFHYDLP